MTRHEPARTPEHVTFGWWLALACVAMGTAALCSGITWMHSPNTALAGVILMALAVVLAVHDCRARAYRNRRLHNTQRLRRQQERRVLDRTC